MEEEGRGIDDHETDPQEGLVDSISGAGKNILGFFSLKDQFSKIVGQLAKDHDLRLEVHGEAVTKVRIVQGGFDVTTSLEGVTLDPVLVPKQG